MASRLRPLIAALVYLAAAHAARGGDLKVGFITPTGPPEFWRAVTTTMQAAAAQLGIDLDIRDTTGSPDKAIGIAREFIARKPDYLIATNDGGDAGEIIKLADAARLKLVLLNSDLDAKNGAKNGAVYGEPRTTYKSWLGSIVSDQEAAGYAIAIAVLTAAARTKANRPLKVLALTGEEQNPVAIARARGLKRGIETINKTLGPGTVELTDLRYLDWTTVGARTAVREFSEKGGHIDVLLAANDPMALGGSAALREYGYRLGRDVFVGGLNWSKEAVAKVLDGDMVITEGGHFFLGAWAMVVLRDHHDGRDFAGEGTRLKIPMGGIDRAVARRFPEIATVDWRRIDFTRFSKTRNPQVKHYEFTTDAVLAQLKPAK